MQVTRREFLRRVKTALAASFCPLVAWGSEARRPAQAASANTSWHEARYYKQLGLQRVKCLICPRECVVDDVERGYCATKENRGGKYYSLVYGKPCAVHVDPIEKKPFFHVLPGTRAFSIATAGCCMECKYCQNWDISQFRPEQTRNYDLSPAEVVRQAKRTRSRSIAFTYSEPVVFYEYMYDTARLAKQEGIHPVVVTSAYICEEPLRDLCHQVSAIKVDLKAFTEKFYREICDSTLKPVLDALQVIKEERVWLEIVYLVVPTLNDNPAEIKQLARWVKANLGPGVPVHFTRFYPMYKLKNLPPTPVSTLERCRTVALEQGLHYVYLGNVPGHPGEHTYCPHCHKPVIKRVAYYIKENKVRNGKCGYCGTRLPGLWT
ncbi:MAG TPA: AmmeMemoRadiSam system radical SAM enzyme [Armatimonadetes bacterium]|nr:AmmeMemoRadiSam system radical SAM enzyme [Armatimonadota bacterium]